MLVSLLAAAAAAGMATGCSEATGPGEAPPIEELPRALTTAEQTVIARSNAFGIDLMREVLGRDDRPNVVLSPLSASMALGMAMEGAEGATFEAMRTGLRFDDLSRDEITRAYEGLLELLPDLDPSVELSIANSAWANEDVEFHESYIERLAASFDARTESLDFADPASVDVINRWVDRNTKGRIEEIVDELDPDLVMILVNAMAFDAPWTTRFDPDDTRPADFTREDGSTVTVDMMSLEDATVLRGGVELGDDSGLSAVELPYGGGAFSMVVAVPWGAASIRDVVARMDRDAWDELLASFEERDMDLLSLPRFELSYDAFLNDPLREMGMDLAFTPDADFTRMSPAGGRFCIDYVRQKTFIEVDEAGTRAAAATAVGVREVSFNGLIVDRPFLFAIRERLSGTLLFVGVVGDPTEKEAGEPEVERACSYR